MSWQPRKVISRSIIVLLLIGGLVLAGYGLAQPTNSIYFAVGAGVLSSLIASVVLGMFTSRALAGQTALADKLLQLEQATESRNRYGATLLDEKYFHKPEYWNHLTASTSKRLLLLGHSLNTWVKPEYRKPFLAAIERVVKNKGDFCIILLDPSGGGRQRIADVRGHDYSGNIASTLEAVAEVHRRLPPKLRDRVDVRFLPTAEQPLYMAMVTDTSLEYSPYFLRESSRTTLHASFTRDSAFSNAVIADFQALRRTCTPVDLSAHYSN